MAVPLVADAVSAASPLAVIASLKTIVVPESVKSSTRVEPEAVVIFPALVTVTFSELPPNVFS